jgi:hypothetical protein
MNPNFCKILSMLFFSLVVFVSPAQELVTTATTPAVLPGKGLRQYDFFYAGEQKHRNMYLIRDGKIAWSYIDTTGRGEISDAVLMSNGNVVFAHQHGVTVIDKNKKVLWQYACKPGTEVHTAQPIGNDRLIYILNADTAKVRVVNLKTGKYEREFEILVQDRGRSHGQFRHARLTRSGNYLVAHMDMSKVCEYDSNGKTVLSLDFQSPWSVEELENGNLLVCSNKNFIREITRKGDVVWEFKPGVDIPEYRIFNLQMAYRLPNGNTLINNWFNQFKRFKMEPDNMPAQFIEVTPDKKVVWALRAWREPVNLGPSTRIQLLDSKKRQEDVFFGPFK